MRRWFGRVLLLGFPAAALVTADYLYWHRRGGAFNHR
jgi:hypothetical protein